MLTGRGLDAPVTWRTDSILIRCIVASGARQGRRNPLNPRYDCHVAAGKPCRGPRHGLAGMTSSLHSVQEVTRAITYDIPSINAT